MVKSTSYCSFKPEYKAVFDLISRVEPQELNTMSKDSTVWTPPFSNVTRYLEEMESNVTVLIPPLIARLPESMWVRSFSALIIENELIKRAIIGKYCCMNLIYSGRFILGQNESKVSIRAYLTYWFDDFPLCQSMMSCLKDSACSPFKAGSRSMSKVIAPSPSPKVS